MIATLASRTPMCATVANSPKRHFFSDKSLVFNCSPPNMVLTKNKGKMAIGAHFTRQRIGWNGKYAQVIRVENEDKRFAWFIHAFLGVWGVAAFSDKLCVVIAPQRGLSPPRHKTYNHNKSCSFSHYAASVKVLARISVFPHQQGAWVTLWWLLTKV